VPPLPRYGAGSDRKVEAVVHQSIGSHDGDQDHDEGGGGHSLTQPKRGTQSSMGSVSADEPLPAHILLSTVSVLVLLLAVVGVLSYCRAVRR